MAKLCSQCGHSLPRENSRFCNHCGAVASPNTSSSPAPRRTHVISGEQSSRGSGSAGTRPVLREQIAFAPSSPPFAPLVPDNVPSWLGKLDNMGSRSLARPPVQAPPRTLPKGDKPSSNAARPFSPGGTRLPQRELRIKVWEDEDAGVEDLPTTPLSSTVAPEKVVKPFSPVARNDLPAGVNALPDEEDRGDADLPTRPLVVNPPLPKPAQANLPSGRPFPAQSFRRTAPPQPSSGQSIDQRQQGFTAQVNPRPGQAPIVQQPVTPALPISYPGFQQPAPPPATTGRIGTGPSPSRTVRRRKSKTRVAVVLVILLLLLGGGLAYWIIAYQPFSVPAITRTSLPFTSTNLGIALRYPQGWTTQLDSAHQTVSFFDANRIDQVNITVTASNSSNIPSFVNKEVTQPGLTAQKNLSPITFAGTSWQQVQGTLLISGATDTETVLVAMHGKQFYTIAQVAPAVTYADADRLFFSILRASFQFL